MGSPHTHTVRWVATQIVIWRSSGTGLLVGKGPGSCLEEVIFLEVRVCTWREEGKQALGSGGSSGSRDCEANTGLGWE